MTPARPSTSQAKSYVPDDEWPSGQDGRIAALILVNGPPGVGKSTLARRYVGDHPLALLLEIDAIRCSLGKWEDLEESKLIARTLATAMAEAHLRAGHDVVVPQYLGRTEFIETLDGIARRAGCAFREILLMDAETAVVDRFRSRRAELSSSGPAHPQTDVDDGNIAQEIADAFAGSAGSRPTGPARSWSARPTTWRTPMDPSCAHWPTPRDRA